MAAISVDITIISALVQQTQEVVLQLVSFLCGLPEGEEWNGFPWRIVPRPIMDKLAGASGKACDEAVKRPVHLAWH